MDKNNIDELLGSSFDVQDVLAATKSIEPDAMSVRRPDRGRASMRQADRYLVRWRLSLVFDGGKGRDTFHGRANDISMGGISIHCDHNIFHKENVTLLLEVPPLKFAHGKRVLEIQSRMIYGILAKDWFRIGLQFVRFAGQDREFLEERLKSNHTLHHVK